MLRKYQLVRFRIVAEHAAITPPVERGLKLALDFNIGIMFIQNVTEQLKRDAVVGLGGKNILNLLEQTNTRDDGLAKDGFLPVDTRFRKHFAFLCQLDVALLEGSEAQQ